jgi:hypothetical protein
MAAPPTRNSQPSQGIFGHLTALLIHPAAFFRRMPQNHQWLWVAVLVLVIFGLAASNQAQSDAAASDTQQTQGFDISLLQDDTAQTSDTAATVTTQTTDSAVTNTTLMAALLAACGVLVMWAGQTVLLCLIPMLRNRPPNLARTLQIAVWASLPLALMLGLRQLYFAAGGTGGSTGLSLLLEQWDGYSALPSVAQSVLAIFMSNVSLFWLWSLALLYLGARYTLNGRRWSATLVLAMWIAAATIVPAVVSEPVTTTAPRTTTAVEETDATSTDGASTSSSQSGPAGIFPGGMPPDGGMPPGG